MFDAELPDLLRAVAITCDEWVDLNDLAGGFSPYGSFVLFRSRALERALALLPFELTANATERVSADPVRDGYVAVLELTRGADAPPARETIDAFVARERDRDMEPYLREVYGDRRPTHDELLWKIDYPVFDNGSADVGFGLATDRVRSRAWLWSRVSFAHK